jgi:hypothetical protein
MCTLTGVRFLLHFCFFSCFFGGFPSIFLSRLLCRALGQHSMRVPVLHQRSDGWLDSTPQTMAQRQDARGSVGEGAEIQVRLLSPVELQQDPLAESYFHLPCVC